MGDTAFLELFDQTAEFVPSDREFSAYKSFNIRAVERGRQIADQLAQIRPLLGRALDVGCGSGGLAIALAESGMRVDAIEPDPLRHSWAQTRIAGHNQDVTLHDAVAEHLPFPDRTFDVVTLDSVIEHVEDPGRVLEEVGRVLAPGGLLYLVSPNKLSLPYLLRDPHYQMFGVVLLPRWLGKLYVERVRRIGRGYWVNRIPSKRWLVRQLAAQGIAAEQMPVDTGKLGAPWTIRHPLARRIAMILHRLGLAFLLPRLAAAQHPVWVLVGQKVSGEGARQSPL